jgi:hypothetical protein
MYYSVSDKSLFVSQTFQVQSHQGLYCAILPGYQQKKTTFLTVLEREQELVQRTYAFLRSSGESSDSVGSVIILPLTNSITWYQASELNAYKNPSITYIERCSNDT